MMKAADVMTENVITVYPDTSVREISFVLLKHRISAVPVVDSDRKVLGVVSEGDLMRRVGKNSASRHSWWLELISAGGTSAEDYIRSHGRQATDVMTSEVVSIPKDMPLHEIAQLLERRRIKRVPVVDEGRLVGIVSRANLLHGLASQRSDPEKVVASDDATIRRKLLDAISEELGLNTGLINVVVNDGVVQLWGVVSSEAERKAAQVAAENVRGVKAVENNLGHVPLWAGAY